MDEKAASDNQLRETVEELKRQNVTLSESLEQVELMFAKEDVGWRSLFNTAEDNGMSLEELRHWSKQIKNAQVGNPHIKHGLTLRRSYVWQGGMKYKNIPGAKQGKGVNVQKLMKNPLNKRNFFGPSAKAKREGSLFGDGIALYIGDDRTKEIHNVPLHEITGEYRDPNWESDIWAYRRTWNYYAPGQKTPVLKNVWYFTDTFIDKRTSTVTLEGGLVEPVDMSCVAFDQIANGVDGFAFGSPDALAALIWSRIVKDLTMDGVAMTDAMATFAFKASVSTKGGADSASMKLASSNPAGSTTVLGATNDLVPMSTAGKGYDFDSFRAVTAVVATALDVSVIALTSDPGTAGSSYGSASTLDLPTRLAMQARRAEHVAFEERVLAWLGAPDAEVYFETLTDPADLYRQQQGVGIKWDTGLYTPKEIKTRLEELEGNSVSDITVPDGVMLPNNEKFKDTLTNDDQSAADAQAATDAKTSVVNSKTIATQGSPAKTSRGKGANANDLRTDTLSK